MLVSFRDLPSRASTRILIFQFYIYINTYISILVYQQPDG